MEGGEAVKIFDIIKAKGMLPTKIDELVPLMFIGDSAVKFFNEKLSLMDKLGLDEQRKATLADGQDAGDMLLDIEVMIGKAAKDEPKVETERMLPRKLPNGKFHGGGGSKPSGKPPKHERLGLPEKKDASIPNRLHHPTVNLSAVRIYHPANRRSMKDLVCRRKGCINPKQSPIIQMWSRRSKWKKVSSIFF